MDKVKLLVGEFLRNGGLKGPTITKVKSKVSGKVYYINVYRGSEGFTATIPGSHAVGQGVTLNLVRESILEAIEEDERTTRNHKD